MSTIIPADYADLLDDATPATLILTTLRRDGLPVLAPVSVDHKLIMAPGG